MESGNGGRKRTSKGGRGPLLILPPALKRWGPPRRQGLCSHLAHLWATSDSAPRSENGIVELCLGASSALVVTAGNAPPTKCYETWQPREGRFFNIDGSLHTDGQCLQLDRHEEICPTQELVALTEVDSDIHM